MKQAKKEPAPPAPNFRAAVAQRIRIERARQRLTQEELAHRSGLSRVHLGAIERSEVSCSIDVLAQIALALDVSPRELLPDRRAAA